MDSVGYEKIMRFISSDPMTHARVEWSPYNFCRNNPIHNVDPTGGLDHPIYDQEGTLLGTDDQGLQGKAIVMNAANFKQGMKQEDALKNNLGYAGLKDDKALTKFNASYNSLPSRPDYDGKLTLSEANDWYRTSGGKPLYVDLAQIDFSTTTKSDVSFNADGKTGYVNLFLTQSPLSEMMDGGGNVYGSIKIAVSNNLAVTSPSGYHDVYDFDQKPWGLNPERWLRNIGTKIGEWQAGKGTPYDIYFYGSNHLQTVTDADIMGAK
ncbi:MAG TPA: RHS repeat-associated core domain-containing protein [Chitinophagaceae bacterium]|nr:RHS repeat-associated core domain-containing protein [Chitinophagaceae bacterium]